MTYYLRFKAWVKFNFMLLIVKINRIMKYLFIILLLASCNPCKYVAKHAECFPADTIKLIEYKTKYVNQYISKDSIIKEVVPCDPAKPETVKETVYKTIWRTSIDTIFSDNKISVLNPINEDNAKKIIDLQNKVDNKNKIIWALIILIVALGVLYKLFK